MKIKKLYHTEDMKSFSTLQEAEYYVYTQECKEHQLAPHTLGKWLLDHYKMTPFVVTNS